jgi:hypothetical protein
MRQGFIVSPIDTSHQLRWNLPYNPTFPVRHDGSLPFRVQLPDDGDIFMLLSKRPARHHVPFDYLSLCAHFCVAHPVLNSFLACTFLSQLSFSSELESLFVFLFPRGVCIDVYHRQREIQLICWIAIAFRP